MCVEREVSEESLERRWNWDHARHEERELGIVNGHGACVDHPTSLGRPA